MKPSSRQGSINSAVMDRFDYLPKCSARMNHTPLTLQAYIQLLDVNNFGEISRFTEEFQEI